jgi:simple sugar transport system permease protein
LLALAAAVVAGMLMSLLHAWLAISVRADQIISGAIINIAAIGLTGYLNTLLSAQTLAATGNFSALTIPAAVASIPLIGWLVNALFGQGPIGIATIVIVIVFQIMLFRSRWGLRTRAVGEHPRAAETVGIDVIRLRYRNVVLSGVLAALGGAYLSMEATNAFQAGMTQGRGFIGLAAMIVGRWTPIGAFGAALLFASSQAISQSISVSPPTGQLGDLLTHVPPQFFDALPYLITIVVLAGLIGRSIAPAADGRPYLRESAS